MTTTKAHSTMSRARLRNYSRVQQGEEESKIWQKRNTSLAGRRTTLLIKGMRPALVEAIAIYSKMTTSDLKQILKWNYLIQSGKKDELVERVIDGHVFGTIPRCPECHGGEDEPDRSTTGRKATTLRCKPSRKGDGQGTWTCKGYHNGSYMIRCNFTADYVQRGEVPGCGLWKNTNRCKRTKQLKKIENSKGMEDAEFDTGGMDEEQSWTTFSQSKEHGYYTAA